MKDTLKFQRYEFKYIMRDHNISSVRLALAQMGMVSDPHVPLNQDSYTVTSLYFDNYVYGAYYSKLAGDRKRYKLRLRYYGQKEQAAQSCFLEVKEKYDSVIYKRRARVSSDQVEKLVNGDALVAVNGMNEKETADMFFSRMRKNGMTPKLLVRYDREPLVWRYNPRLRVTFDKSLSYRVSDNLFDTGECDMVRPGTTIMELKFDGFAPGWIHEIIRRFNLSCESASKYCLGLREAGRRGAVALMK